MIRQNFTAELHCQYGQIVVKNAPLEPFIPTHFETLKEGWLIIDKGNNPKYYYRLPFEFEYLKTEENRHHYHIACAEGLEFKWARLEQSRNGWLGLYATSLLGRLADVMNPANLFTKKTVWTIEPLDRWNGDISNVEQIEFYLRNEQDHRVANSYSESENYWGLRASALGGDILKLRLRNITPT